jgi:hypothetical protein
MKLASLVAAALLILPGLALTQTLPNDYREKNHGKPSQSSFSNDISTEQSHDENSKAITDDDCTQLKKDGNSQEYRNKCLTEEEKILYNEQAAAAKERSQPTVNEINRDFKDSQRDMKDHEHEHGRKKDDGHRETDGN